KYTWSGVRDLGVMRASYSSYRTGKMADVSSLCRLRRLGADPARPARPGLADAIRVFRVEDRCSDEHRSSTRKTVAEGPDGHGGAGRAHGGAGAARRSWVSSCASRRAAQSAEPGGVDVPLVDGGAGGTDHERHRRGARVDDALGDVADVAGAAASCGGLGRRAGGLDRGPLR